MKSVSNHVSIINRLPLELVAMVMERLVEYNLAPGRYTKYTEEYAEEPCFQGRSIDPITNWVKLTGEARMAILNARLSCWKLHAASSTSFATLLGDRKFRYTKTGLDDPEHVAQQTALVPHITTLTIACGGFRNVDDMHSVREAVVELEVADQNRLLEAYAQCAAWQGDEILDYQCKLASVFRMFPKLSTIRINTRDNPRYLGGWLESGDLHMLHLQDCLEEKINPITAKTFAFHGRSKMYRRNVIDASHIIDALVLAGTTLKGLRIWGMDWDCFSALKIQPFSLHTLRVNSDTKYSYLLGVNAISTSYLDSALYSLPNLQDLSLDLADRIGFLSLSKTMKVLTEHTKLRRLSLVADWDLDASELISMVEAHSRNLEYLLLDGAYLRGSWSTTLDAIFRIGKGRLKIVQGIEVNSHAGVNSPKFDFTVTEEDLENLRTAADWQSWLDQVGDVVLEL